MMVSTSRITRILVFLAAFVVIGCDGQDDEARDTSIEAGASSAALPSEETPTSGHPLYKDGTPPEMPDMDDIKEISDECCTQVGQADECWMEDATNDGIICPTWFEAPSGYALSCLSSHGCNGTSSPSYPSVPAGILCECEDNDDCYDGSDRFGICIVQPGDTVGLCGPSWCNGFKICSCFGGCTDATIGTTPAATCTNAGQFCCEGEYPQHPELNTVTGIVGFGYCSDDVTCGEGCNNDGDCDDGDECTQDVCVLATGQCTYGDILAMGLCDDGNVCTDESCDSLVPGGCVWTNNTDPCSDGDACTENDVCAGGSCQPGPPLNCDDGNPCTDNSCDSILGCQTVNNTDLCDDGDACTTGDICTAGACVPTGTLVCDDTNLCTDDSCNPASGCVFTNNSLACDDGDACTTGDTCTGGSCVPTGILTCDDGNPCTDDTCDSVTGCSFVNNTNACDDGNACTGGDVCGGGICAGAPITCDDLNDCTDDTCHPITGCLFTPNSDPCDDGDACTTGDTCMGTVCTPTGTLTCDDSNICTDDSCNSATGCVFTNNSVACDDGDACTTGDICSGGACTSTGTLTCDDSNICTDDTCDSVLGCVHTNNSAACDDGDICTTGDICSGGSCITTGILDCDDSNICTDDSCIPASGCFHSNNSDPCDDLDACTTGDICSGGSCVGAAVDCNDSDVCTIDTCLPATGCVNTVIPLCCLNDAMCVGTCPGGASPPPVGCKTDRCDIVTHLCYCEVEAAGTLCTDYDSTVYPPNCFEGRCGEVVDPTVWPPSYLAADGQCTPVQHPAYNNLCSDVFIQPAGTVLDVTHDAYMGSFANTGAITTGPDAAVSGNLLSIGGSTTCAGNNYESVGADCLEMDGDNIGIDGLDLVYVFEYQTNSPTQFDLHSYLIKLEGDFDLGMYIMTDVDIATDCPEGNDPGNPLVSVTVDSSRCNYPFADAPPPPVVEDQCDDSGNTSAGQECCDPCASPACYTNGYYWCERGYPDGCDMCGGGCVGIWTYPEDPFNCIAETAYPVANMASTIIFPEGDTDGSWRRVFIFVDGVTVVPGNFEITIERRKWYASPCDRINDDARVFDLTHPEAGGATYLGSLDNVVNSFHSGFGACGGYNCSPTAWTGAFFGCHDGSTPNQFWPNAEYFKIHRQTGEGASAYCIVTDESVASGADLVVEVYKRSNATALTICDESYGGFGCERDNFGNNIKYTLNAAEGELYLIGFSQYAGTDRPCTSGAPYFDNCNYKITVYEGTCPAICQPALEGAAGSAINITAANWSTYNIQTRNGSLYNTDGDEYVINGSDDEDDMYVINNTSGNTVQIFVEMCGADGDPMLALYNCDQVTPMIAADSFGSPGVCETFTYSLPSSTDPYYLTAQTWGAADITSYTMTIEWGWSCGDGSCDGAETAATCPADCGSASGNCCSTGHGAGCSIPAIEACVCVIDVFCCISNWDGFCVNEVTSFGCGVCP